MEDGPNSIRGGAWLISIPLNSEATKPSLDSNHAPTSVTSGYLNMLADSNNNRYDGLGSVSGFDWVIDNSKVSLNNLRSIQSPSGRFKVYEDAGVGVNYAKRALYYNCGCDYSTKGYLSYNGQRDYCTLIFKDVAASSTGVKADLKIIISNIYRDAVGAVETPSGNIRYDHSLSRPAYPLILADMSLPDGSRMNLYTVARQFGLEFGSGYTEEYTGGHMDFHYSLLNPDTGEVISGQKMLAVFSDIDMWGKDGYNGGMTGYVEGVRINSPVGEVYMEPGSYLNVSGNEYLATRPVTGDEVKMESIAFLADTDGLSVTTSNWGSSGLAMGFMLEGLDFPTYQVTPSSNGPGSISPNSVQNRYAGANVGFIMEPNSENDYLKSFTVDDVEQAVSDATGMAYYFNDIRESHSIHAEFATKQYKIKFNRNIPSGGNGTMELMDCFCGTKYNLSKNLFSWDGHLFMGWNTKPDGSGEAFVDEYAFINLSDTDGDIIELYAQWEAADYSILYHKGDSNR